MIALRLSSKTVAWRVGTPQRHKNTGARVLGELGGCSPHDPPTTPNDCCRSYGWIGPRRGLHQPHRSKKRGEQFERCAWGCEPPSPPHQLDEHEPRGVRGWQHEAVSRVEVDHKNRHVFPVLTQTEKALLRAQSGPAAEVAFSDVLCSFFTRIEPHLFWTPLSPCPRLCRCGRPLHSHGHHRAVCSRAGVIAVKSAAARICREAGARVTTNVLMRGLDVGVPVADTRRLEVVADGLPLFGGMQLAVDTKLGSTLHGSERRSWRRRHCPCPC